MFRSEWAKVVPAPEPTNLADGKLGPKAGTQLLDRFVQGTHFEIDHTPKTDFNAAQALYRQYDGLSFVDSTIAACMQRREIEFLYSFDDDFDAIDDLTRLETAIDPFR